MDSLKPIEIVVSFAALCRWNESPGVKEDSRLSVTTKTKGAQRAMQAAAAEVKSGEPGTSESSSVADGTHSIVYYCYLNAIKNFFNLYSLQADFMRNFVAQWS